MPKININKNASLFLVLFIGTIISLGIFFYLNSLKISSNKQLVEEAMLDTKQKTTKELKKVTLAISSLQMLFEMANHIDREQFNRFTLPFVEGLPGIRALEWAPKILNSERAAYEASVIAEGFDSFKITQSDSINKRLVVAAPKEHYFPVHFIVPLGLNKIALGFDLSSNSDRAHCIDESNRTNKIAVSPPLKLIQDTDGSSSFLIIQSVGQNETQKGVILGVYNVSQFVNTILKPELKLLNIHIYDKNSNRKYLYSNTKDDKSPTAKIMASTLSSNHFEIGIGDRIWEVYISPQKQMLDFPHLPVAYACLFLGFCITFLLMLVIYNNIAANNRLEQKVKDRTQELNNANKQQVVLLKEIHHRVKNNLQVITSLLSLQSSNIEDIRTKEIFSVSQYRINAMAMLHEELYQSKDLSKISYKQYLKKVVEHLIVSIKGVENHIALNLDIPENLKLNIDTAIPLGLIINEIVTNSLKYGIPNQNQGEIQIKITSSDYPNFQLFISDDGLGFSDDINHITTKSLGLKLIRQLTRQLNGRIEKEKVVKGTQYKVYFQEIS